MPNQWACLGTHLRSGLLCLYPALAAAAQSKHAKCRWQDTQRIERQSDPIIASAQAHSAGNVVGARGNCR